MQNLSDQLTSGSSSLAPALHHEVPKSVPSDQRTSGSSSLGPAVHHEAPKYSTTHASCKSPNLIHIQQDTAIYCRIQPKQPYATTCSHVQPYRPIYGHIQPYTTVYSHIGTVYNHIQPYAAIPSQIQRFATTARYSVYKHLHSRVAYWTLASGGTDSASL